MRCNAALIAMRLRRSAQWAMVSGRGGQVVGAGRPRQLALYDRSAGLADRRMTLDLARLETQVAETIRRVCAEWAPHGV